jgi:hypothetical protein
MDTLFDLSAVGFIMDTLFDLSAVGFIRVSTSDWRCP